MIIRRSRTLKQTTFLVEPSEVQSAIAEFVKSKLSVDNIIGEPSDWKFTTNSEDHTGSLDDIECSITFELDIE